MVDIAPGDAEGIAQDVGNEGPHGFVAGAGGEAGHDFRQMVTPPLVRHRDSAYTDAAESASLRP